jgi:hypothetical protein
MTEPLSEENPASEAEPGVGDRDLERSIESEETLPELSRETLQDLDSADDEAEQAKGGAMNTQQYTCFRCETD